MSKYKNLSNNLKPREKFKYLGPETLNELELLIIILATGSKKNSVSVLAQILIEKYGTVNNIVKQEIDELCTNDGIGEVKAIRLKSLYYLDKILKEYKLETNINLNNSKSVYELLKDCTYFEEEQFIVVCLNSKNNYIGHKILFKGTINSVDVNNREIFKYALGLNSKKIILAHNHPSGNTNPSKGDVEVTKYLVECSKSIGIEIVDHLIITKTDYLSLREKYDFLF